MQFPSGKSHTMKIAYNVNTERVLAGHVSVVSVLEFTSGTYPYSYVIDNAFESF